MSAFPSAAFPEYGSCGNYQSHSFPYHQQPQSHSNHGHNLTHPVSHSRYECGEGSQFCPPAHLSSQMNMASAPPPPQMNAFPPYPPPYSPYPGHCHPPPGPGPMPAGVYQPQMPYPTQQAAGWYQGPPMSQPQVVHVVTTEQPRNEGCGCCGTCCASLLAMCCFIECMEHCCHD